MLLRTLGAFELFDGSTEDSGRVLPAGKALALVAYLALAPGRRARRDTLLDLLWSDVEPERGRRTLRQTVWALRQRLGESAIVNEGDELVLAIPLEADALAFTRDVEAGRHEAAWARYRGHFIPVFATPGGAGFEQWADLERDRLRTMWRTIGEELARHLLAAGQVERATTVARQLREDDPDHPESWYLLISGLLAGRQPLQARLEADAAAAMLARTRQRPEGRLAALLDRARHMPLEPPPEEPTRAEPELVGRERAFASLLTAWQTVAGGRGATVLVRGAAGLGKTRLLRDFHARLTTLGPSTVLVRARPGERDLPYALAAGLAQAVGGLPGARGVSPATAAALVALAPGLSNWFPKGPPAEADQDELLRVRTLALVELIETVAEESPLALLVDDLHWADEPSRQILASLASRLQEQSVLTVISARPMRGGWQVPAGAELVELPPLTAAHLEQLLASLAGGEPALLADLSRVLHVVSAGVPLLALAALDLALERRRLRLVEGHWECPDLDALRHELSRGSVLDQLLQALPIGSGPVLLALALAGRPLDDRLLASVSEHPDGGALAPVLEQRGLLVRLGDEWEIAHDRIAEAALAIATPDQRDAVARRLGHGLLDIGAGNPRLLRVAGQLLATVQDPDAAIAFRGWLHATRRRRHWRNPVAAAAELLGEGATVAQAQALARRLPLLARFRHGWPELALVVAAALVAGAGFGLVALLRGALSPPAARLSATFPPASRGFLFDTARVACAEPPWCGTNPLPVRVDFRDAWGRPTARAPDSVRVRLLEDRGLRLAGAPVLPVHGGQADFSGLAVEGSGSFVLEVTAGSLPPVRSERYWAVGPVPLAPELRLVSGEVAGQHVDSVRRTVTVEPGASLSGTIRVRTLTTMLDAAILMGAVATWGDRRTNYMPLRALPSHGMVEVDVRLEDANAPGRALRAPASPGRYRLVVVFLPETEMRYIASMTNWLVGTPSWHDGNDIVDWDRPVLDRLDVAGVVDGLPLLMRPHEQGALPSPMVPVSVAGTTIEVVVGDTKR
jgi:DNA-binding SARP family transcriptional activator